MARHRILDWIAPSVLWLWLFHHLHYEWTLNPQYNYGWTVPFLGVLIFFLRWRRRPSPGPQIAGGGITLLLWLILLSLLPFRVIEEANPDWRLLGWILGGPQTTHPAVM